MWAIKNFVCGPSAAVAIGRRPCPGAIGEEHAAGGQRAGRLAAIGQRAGRPAGVAIGHRPCAISTLVGGDVGSVHMTRRLAGRVAFCLV